MKVLYNKKTGSFLGNWNPDARVPRMYKNEKDSVRVIKIFDDAVVLADMIRMNLKEDEWAIIDVPFSVFRKLADKQLGYNTAEDARKNKAKINKR